MPTRRLPVKRAAQIKPYVPAKQRRVPTGYREVFIHGIPYGLVHLVEVHGAEQSSNQTICQNRAGQTPAPGADQRRCPVCWKNQTE